MPHKNRSRVITKYPGSVKIRHIAVLGTRESMGYKIRFDQNQKLELKDQLNSGVRVLNIGVRATSNRFAVHKRAWFLNTMFGSVIQTVWTFLDANPGEIVFMLIHKSYSEASDVNKSHCEILRHYMNRRMITNWTLDDSIAMHRGNLLLATIGDKTFGECIMDLKPQCRLSSQLIRVEYHDRQIQTKIRELKALQEASFSENYQCFISFLSDDFMVSRWDAAVEGTDRYCDQPINFFMADYFWNSNRGFIVLIADYPTQELIDQVNYSNFFFFPAIY